MSKTKQQKSPLPPFEDFEQKFQDAFGRELTREERRFYRLIGIVLDEEFSQANELASAS